MASGLLNCVTSIFGKGVNALHIFDLNKYATEYLNLALTPDVRIAASVAHPSGRGARDPAVLLNETAYRLDGRTAQALWQYRKFTYDTYDGQNEATELDWYALHFPARVTLNCIDMTMECAHRDGGWWTSLHVEAQRPDGAWLPVENLKVFPPYQFNDVAYGRMPYQTHALTFDAVTASTVRVIGRAGGIAQFTSLARLAVYSRDLSRWNPASLPPPPIPYLFHLISPHSIWDMSASLVKLTGLQFGATLLEYYLDRERYEQWSQRVMSNYQGKPELWLLLGESLGWDEWSRLENSEPDDLATLPHSAYVRLGFHNRLARAVAPVVVENQVLGELTSGPVLLKDCFDLKWHRHHAEACGIAWSAYRDALKRSPQMTIEQLEGAASLMGILVNNITSLAHRNWALERELEGTRRSVTARAQSRQEVVRRAIDYMQQNLETPVTVNDVARYSALTPSYFGILFAEVTGQTPREYLIELRLERARQYLAHGDMSVLDICVALGYDPSYFSRLFKQRTGMTPMQYSAQSRAVSRVNSPER